MGFNELSKLWFLTLLIPLIVLYFLKLKRPRVKVPSLFLWRQVLDDQRVNSPFQRFKRHLLLLLQLLILSLLVLAAAGPFFTGRMNHAKRIPIIIDISASMGAVDKNGVSRLERAKKKIKALISEKVTGQEYAIITFSDRSRKECGFTDNSATLLDVLAKIKVDDVPANIEDALIMVQSMSKNFPFKEAMLFSDGNFPAEANFSLSFKLSFQKISDDAQNIGITALSAQRTGEKDWTIFAEVNSTPKAPGAALELYRNGKLSGEDSYAPSSDNSERIRFRVSGERASFLTLKIKPDGHDSLQSDNSAFIQLPELRKLQIYISPELKPVLAAMHGIQNIAVSTQKSLNPFYDLAVTQKKEASSKKNKILVSTGFIPDDLQQILKPQNKDTTVVDWKKEVPILRHAELGELSILSGTAYKPGKSAKDVEKAGYQILIFGNLGPLLLRKSNAEQTYYCFLFDLNKSTLPYRIAFPIIIQNLVELARKKAGLSDIVALKTGIISDLTLQPETEYTVTAPDGTTEHIKTRDDGLIPGVTALNTGIYKFSSGSKEDALVGVSLLNKSETLLKGTDKIAFNTLSVSSDEPPPNLPKALWKYLAILALILLFIEWWIFNKRAQRRKQS